MAPAGGDHERMPELVVGLMIGVALGMTVIGFIAIGSFDRGWDAALRQRALGQMRRVR